MSASEIMQGFMTHRKKPTDNASDFGFQLRTYLDEWVLREMNVTIFEGLTEFLATDQIKREMALETRGCFIEKLPTIK